MNYLIIFFFAIQTAEEWRIVFYISSGIYLFGCLVYWFWASGEEQPWARVHTEEIDESAVEVDRTLTLKQGHINEGANLKE